MRVLLSSQFSRHLVETLDRIRYEVYRFETFTYGPVDRDPGNCELPTNIVNPTTEAKEKMLTLAAESKASFQKSRVNFDFAFAHSLRSGVWVNELRVA